MVLVGDLLTRRLPSPLYSAAAQPILAPLFERCLVSARRLTVGPPIDARASPDGWTCPTPPCIERRRSLMFDLAAIAIALACFAFVFLLLYVLDRV